MLGESSQNQIFQLDCVIRQRIHKVKMEVAQELWVVLENDQNNVHCGCVEATHGR